MTRKTPIAFFYRFVFVCLIAFTFQSCRYPSIFLSNTTNVPNLSQKKDGNVSAYLGLDHVELQGAYSPKNRLGLFVNSYTTYGTFLTNTNTGIEDPSVFFEAASGYYQLIKESLWFFDLYGGVGYGHRSFKGANDPYDMTGQIHQEDNIRTVYGKVFFQSSIFYKVPGFQFTLSNQIGGLFFNVMDITEGGTNGYPLIFHKNYSPFSVLNDNIALTFKMGRRNCKFILQLTANIAPDAPFSGSPFDFGYSEIFGYQGLYFNSRPLGINIGLQYTFGHTAPKTDASVIQEK